MRLPALRIAVLAVGLVITGATAIVVDLSRTHADTGVTVPPTIVCTGPDAADWDCYDTYYNDLTRAHGVPAAFADLKARYGTDGYVASQCHPITHVIGRAAAQDAANVSEAYRMGDSFCWSGFYHGVLEAIIARIGNENLIKELDGICADIPGKERYVFDYYNCVHGLGHGIMAATDNELFDSLGTCDHLTGRWEQASCASGVYMENVIVDGKLHVTKYLNPEDPVYPCNKSPEKYKQTCYLMQTSYMLKVVGGDFRKVFERCAAVEKPYDITCYQSLGRDVSGQSISDVETTRRHCLLGHDAPARTHCFIGAVKDFISYYHSDVQARELCRAIAPDYDATCFETVEDYYRSF